jgi:bifunctional non-homologous end joining protein LigD
MRDFSRTPEPAGDRPESEAGLLRFVVQHHRARRKHYDFRLEVDGVLASWAMPKGPSLDPKTRALAVHVEDHPIEYRDFEGVIPRGEYGGGDVIVWDRGTWVPATDDPAGAIAAGEIHFDLQGEKLRGRCVLVRTRIERNQEQWLMLHKNDEYAVPGWKPDDHPRSVKSGRTNDEVAADPDSLWHSDRPAAEAETRVREPLPRWDAPTDDELAALDALKAKGSWVFQGRKLQLTNLDKVLFPPRAGESPVTKRELIRYHAVIAPLMLPYLYDRPVNLNRYPDGAGKPGFWHKQAPSYAPDWIPRWNNTDADPGESEQYFVVDSPPALAWMANYGAIELHPWTSALADVHRPTWALIDIDPGTDTTPQEVLVLSRLFRAGLEHLGVSAVAKVTGQRGVHIWIPVEPIYSFSETSKWVEKLSRAVGATIPELVSWTWKKSERSGLARLDYTQNARNKTLVAPYSARPAAGAPVSAPIKWEELDDDNLRSDAWTIRGMPQRVAEVGDLWGPLLHRRQELPDL